MINYKMIIQYDGTDYSGWQVQNGSNTIQQTLVDALDILLKEKVNLIGSGRTDSGVHAIGQTANFRTEKVIDIYKFKHSLNSILPSDISVSDMEQVDENFHARFDAKRRTYLYLISKQKSPFFKRYSYYYNGNTNLSELNRLSLAFRGDRNYTSFSKKSEDIENKHCEVYNAEWYEEKGLIVFEITANRYLHGMVRTITGTILKAVESGEGIEFIENIFSEKNREAAPMAVPACGLFLFKVEY